MEAGGYVRTQKQSGGNISGVLIHPFGLIDQGTGRRLVEVSNGRPWLCYQDTVVLIPDSEIPENRYEFVNSMRMIHSESWYNGQEYPQLPVKEAK